jgi:RNA polymerase sigma factor (sigma-70 family)
LNVSQSTARRFLAGEEEAFNEVYSAYRKLLYFIIGSIVGNSEDAEDVFQDVFLHVYKNRGNIKNSGDLHWYLVRSARNEALSFVQKRDALVDYSPLLDVYGKEDTKENLFLEEMLEGLSNGEAMTVIYKVEWGFSFKEIASLMGVTRQSVAKYYRSGMGKLKRRYGGEKNVH